MKHKERYVTKHLIENVDFLEQDFVFMEDVGFDPNKMEDLIPIQPFDTVDTEPIKIDTLINTLQDLKTKGASHVAIIHCIDHFGYHLSGFAVKKSTPSEIKEFKAFLKEVEALQDDDYEDEELYPDETPDIKPIGPSAKNA